MQQFNYTENHGNTTTNRKRLIYRNICGGGNFITQAEPTNFHKFYTRKILTPTESISDWREVTEAEKTALEEADAKWTAPSEEFVRTVEARGAVYNRDTGFFELNGLRDLTTEEMALIYATTAHYGTTRGEIQTLIPAKIRTNFNVESYTIGANLNTSSDSAIEVLAISSKNVYGWTINIWTLSNLYQLREITGPFYISSLGRNTFVRLLRLEKMKLGRLNYDLDLSGCPALSAESVAYMVEHAINTATITITLHPDAYARVTEEIFTAAAEKQITIASA